MKTNLSRIIAISWLVAPLAGLAQNATLITTFTNPTPAAYEDFGYSVAAVGSDRVLIGALFGNSASVGAAYLFSTNGTLLTTFTNPATAGGDYFGWSVAAVGSEQVLIGAPYDNTGASFAGAAYLFSTNGTLLMTFTNPTPVISRYFARSVVGLGSDRMLIGAYQNDTGAMDAGAVYLFSTDGTWLNTFTNPTPASEDYFGSAVAAAGSDRVLIGAYSDNTGAMDAGAAYLFGANGTLLTTFTNPTAAFGDYFVSAVAAVGSDRVLIGALYDDTGAMDAGTAYLFSTNGTLLTTFTNPTPAENDRFGSALAAVGTEWVIIGSPFDDTGATNAGAAYLFSKNGMLLATITKPAPALGDFFGFSVAVVGSDRVLIGAFADDTGATDAGAAYLFSISAAVAPSLIIWLTTTNTVAISWSSLSTGFTLQQNTSGVSSLNWSNVTDTIQDDGTNKALIINSPTDTRFYRLFKP